MIKGLLNHYVEPYYKERIIKELLSDIDYHHNRMLEYQERLKVLMEVLK